MSQAQSPDEHVDRVAHVRPEDAGTIAGSQPVDDSVETYLRHIQAREAQGGDDLKSRAVWYGAVILALVVGSFLSGFDPSSGDGGGGGVSTPIGLIDLTPLLDVLASGVAA